MGLYLIGGTNFKIDLTVAKINQSINQILNLYGAY